MANTLLGISHPPKHDGFQTDTNLIYLLHNVYNVCSASISMLCMFSTTVFWSLTIIREKVIPANGGINQSWVIDYPRLPSRCLKELELGERQKRLITIEEAVSAITTSFTAVRVKLQGLPDRVSLELSGMTEASDIYNRLDEVIRETLEALASEFDQN